MNLSTHSNSFFTNLTKTFRFFSYSYGKDLATSKVIFWLISMNILSVLIAGIEIYAWTDAAENHISEAAGVYIGSITGIVLWLFDQWLISTDTAEFERLEKKQKLKYSIIARGVIFVISIAATSYFLASSLGRQDAIHTIRQHNLNEITRINALLNKKANEENNSVIKLKSERKSKLENEIDLKKKEIEKLEKGLLSKKSVLRKTNKGRILRDKKGNPITYDLCQGGSCADLEKLRADAKKDLEEIQNEYNSLEDIIEGRIDNKDASVSPAESQFIKLEDDKRSTIDNIKVKYCLEITCDFWYPTAEGLAKASVNVNNRESQMISAIIMFIISTAFLMFKVLEPEEVRTYYNSELQETYQSYKKGLFNDIIDAKEHYNGISPMGNRRFKKWFYNEYEPMKLSDDQLQKKAEDSRRKAEERLKIQQQLENISNKYLYKETERQDKINAIAESKNKLSQFEQARTSYQSKVNTLKEQINNIDEKLKHHQTEKDALEIEKAQFSFYTAVSEYMEQPDPNEKKSLLDRLNEKKKIQDYLDKLESDKATFTKELAIAQTKRDTAKNNVNQIQEAINELSREGETGINKEGLKNLLDAQVEYRAEIAKLADSISDYEKRIVAHEESVKNKREELKQLETLIKNIIETIASYFELREQEVKEFLFKPVIMTSEAWRNRANDKLSQINKLIMLMDNLVDDKSQKTADLQQEKGLLEQQLKAIDDINLLISSHEIRLKDIYNEMRELNKQKEMEEQKLKGLV